MIRMFRAKAEARIEGGETLARMVFVGPVLKNRQKTAANISTHASGNGVKRIKTNSGNASNIPAPETRKYEPGKRDRSRSPAIPPSSVANRPDRTTMPPKMVLIRNRFNEFFVSDASSNFKL